MSNEEQEDQVAVSEQVEVTQQDSQEEEPKMVPLAAMMGEKKRRQEAERGRIEAEARAQLLEEMMQKSTPVEEEDPEALLTKSSFKQEKALTKREILEQVYQDMNPEAVQKINTYLKPILDKKPWLASTIDNAVNRLARANEIVEDYIHLVEKPKVKQSAADAQRIVENSQKPRSPVEVGKSAQPTGTEYLKSIQGKKEFREYRQKVLRGEA